MEPTRFTPRGSYPALGDSVDDQGFDIASEQSQKRMESLYQLADRLATMATAALALTVTFRKDKSASTTDTLWMLKASWISFIGTIIGFLFVYLGRINIHRRLTRDAIRSDRPYVVAVFPWYARIGQFLLILSFLAGIGLLAYYGLAQ